MAVLEAPLTGADRGTDISFRIENHQQALELSGLWPPGQTRTWFETWAATGHPPDGVDHAWLEFDLPPDSSVVAPAGQVPPEVARAEPIVCVRLRRNHDPEAVFRQLWSGLVGEVPSSEALRQSRRCVQLCRELGGRPLYLFALQSRPGHFVRLELVGLGPGAMERLVGELASKQAADQVREAVELVSEADRHHLSLDFPTRGATPWGGETWSERIGVEASYERIPSREPGWRLLFDRLVDSGACDPARRDAVFAWPGQAGRRSPSWPEHVPGHLARCLSHVKLVTRPGVPPTAKVYLLFQYLPKRPAR